MRSPSVRLREAACFPALDSPRPMLGELSSGFRFGRASLGQLARGVLRNRMDSSATFQVFSSSSSCTGKSAWRTWNCFSMWESFRPVSLSRNLRMRMKACAKKFRNKVPKKMESAQPYSRKGSTRYKDQEFQVTHHVEADGEQDGKRQQKGVGNHSKGPLDFRCLLCESCG
jgi:hypothetical protein